jgi:hypothetical protein
VRLEMEPACSIGRFYRAHTETSNYGNKGNAPVITRRRTASRGSVIRSGRVVARSSWVKPVRFVALRGSAVGPREAAGAG